MLSDQRWGAVFRLVDTFERLFNSAKIFEMTIPYNKNSVCDAILDLIGKKFAEILLHQAIVFMVQKGWVLSTKGCSVNVAIAAWPWGTYLGDEGLENEQK